MIEFEYIWNLWPCFIIFFHQFVMCYKIVHVTYLCLLIFCFVLFVFVFVFCFLFFFFWLVYKYFFVISCVILWVIWSLLIKFSLAGINIFFNFFLESFNVWRQLLMITLYHQTKTPIGFWDRWGLIIIINALSLFWT